MILVVGSDFRFFRLPDDSLWTNTAFKNSFWHRYLEVFESVKIVARSERHPQCGKGWSRVDGPGIQYLEVPYYLGPFQYLWRLPQVRKVASRAVQPDEAAILRVGSQVATSIVRYLMERRHPYGLEVVGDPYMAFAPGAIHHPLRPVFRRYAAANLRKQCARAAGVAYVTRETLQSRYPSGAYSVGVSDIDLSADNLLSGSAVYQTHYSSVELRDADVTTSHDFRFGNTDPALIFVGSLEQMYKGPDILLHAVAICRRRGHNIRLTIVGDGRHRHQLERLAENLGVRQLVTFAGTLPSGKAVWDALDAAWIFVLPSRTEGLPRAMVEAMARGLPCIGSRVGGIPELLPPEDTVEPGDPQQLAAKIAEFVNDRKRLETASQRNLRKAHEYRDQELRPRRLSFYRHIRDVTADWILRERAA